MLLILTPIGKLVYIYNQNSENINEAILSVILNKIQKNEQK